MENDCTRVPCAGGVNGNGAGPTVDHVAFVWVGWAGLVVEVAVVPRPPPNWPTIASEVGMVFAVAAPVGVNERLFVRLIVRVCPVGTVITTGDHVDGTPTTVDTDPGFNAAHVAVDVTPAASGAQK